MNDSTVEILVEVTQEDIDKGERACSAFCPVAIAIKRATGVEASVGIRSYSVFPQGRRLSGELPGKVGNWIGSFDADELVKPFNFTLAVPAAAISVPRPSHPGGTGQGDGT